MFNDLSIRNKLILLLAGPLVIILLLSALGARDRRSSASESQRVERLAGVARANADVADALQQEALYSAAHLGSNREAWAQELETARANTDTVLAQATPRLRGDLGGTTSDVQSAAELALGAADKLTFFRESVDQGLRPDQVHQMVVNYADTQSTFIATNTALAGANPDPSAAAQLRTAAALAGYKAALATQGASLAGAGEQGSFGSDAAVAVFRDAQALEADRFALLNALSDRELKGQVRDALATDASKVFEALRTDAGELGPDGAISTDPEAILGAAGATVKDLHEVEGDQYEALLAATEAARSSAERASSFFLIAALVAIAGAAFAALVLGRLITRPLRRLTDAADRLAGEQMPRLIESLKNPAEDELSYQIGSMKPIDIDSHDEIGHLARAFNEVQRVAGDVAAEQAQLLRKGIGEMFVNLARRNQALLDRQIEFIDELERGEEDPDQLDNLYKLDHLATRMRRNAESLLVLAGAEPPRRRGRPAPLANVVRAALAEVEDFGRIELLSFDEVLVASNAAADLAHLLSELMENATNFSPPETRVEVVGHKTKADGYVISVTDHGIGMSPDQIAEANESLAKPPLVGLAMSRSLGFIVVGRLAARHGIAVRMMPSAAGGVTAVVSIPPSLVVDTPGGMADAQPMVEPPARLKQVFESPGASGPSAAPDTEQGGASPFDAGALLEPVAGPAKPEPAVFAPPTPVAADDSEPVAWPPAGAPAASTPAAAEPDLEAALPTSSIFDAAAPEVEADEALVAEVEEAVGPAMPAALSFGPPPSVAAAGSDKLEAPRPAGAPKPFFLEDAAPPRPFGAAPTGPSAKQDAHQDPPSSASPPRLFGGPKPAAPATPAAAPGGLPGRTPRATPAPPAAAPSAPEALPADPEVASDPAPDPASDAPAPGAPTPGTPKLDTRPPLAPRPAAAAPRPTPVAPAPAPDAEAPAADASAAPAPSTTSSGLAKRVPRAAGGVRAIPGSEVERGVAGSRRSPEEVRKMLALHSAGRQRARAQDQPVPAGAPEETRSHD